MSRTTQSGIRYQNYGEGDRSVVLVHGSFVSSKMWLYFVEPIQSAGYKVITLDLQGHGESKGNLLATDMDSYAQNIKDVILVENLTDVNLIGHSMSGLTALMLADLKVVKSIIAIDPSPTLEVQGVKSTENIPDTFNAMDVGMPTDQASIMSTLNDMSQEDLMLLNGMLGNESGAARRQRKKGVSVNKELLVNKNVLFIAAENGKSLPFGIALDSTKAMARYYNKKLVIVPEATHPGILMGKHAHKATDAVTDFLRDLN